MGRIALIKCDVEGAELDVMKGAGGLLRAADAPMWLFEINLETSAAWGFDPGALIRFLADAGPYEFLRISARGKVMPLLEGQCGHGDNVLAYLPRQHGERVGGIGRTIGRVQRWD